MADKTLKQIEPTIAEKFMGKIQRQLQSSLGADYTWTPVQQMLGQNLYVKLDNTFKALEIKRASNQKKANDPPVTWANVNMESLAVATAIRVRMELDASQPNQVEPIPYLNKRTGKYDVDLRVGYMGKDLVSRKFALNPILQITYQLVHETDEFNRGTNKDGGEWVTYSQKNPFNPGKVVGGFGHIVYEDPRLNRVIVVEYREFEKAKKASQGVEFWGGVQRVWKNNQLVDGEFDEKFEKEMQYKTVVHRVNKHVQLDTAKISGEMVQALSESDTDFVEMEVENTIEEKANQGEPLTLSAPKVPVADKETGEVLTGDALKAAIAREEALSEV